MDSKHLMAVFSLTSLLRERKRRPRSRAAPRRTRSLDSNLFPFSTSRVSPQLTDRQLCDVELLANGGFSPLTGFMNEEEYLGVVNNMRLPNGLLFSIPVIFDTDDESLQVGDKILLTQGEMAVATFQVESKYLAQKPLECKNLYGTASLEHPGVLMVALERGSGRTSKVVSTVASPIVRRAR